MHRRQIEDTLSAVRPAAAWVDEVLAGAALSDEARNDLHVCLEEALANLIMHGKPRDGVKAIAIELEPEGGAVALTVSDHCMPFDITDDELFAASTAPSETRIGGNGLRLIRALASELTYTANADSNVLRMRFGSPPLTDAETIRKIPAFAETSDAALSALLAGAERVSFAKDARLIAQGEPSDFALIITSGEVAVVNESQHGDAPVARIVAPALLGEIGALANLRRTASVRAQTSVTALKIDRGTLMQAGQHFPDMLISVISQLGQQVQGINTVLGLYAAGLSALERDDFDPSILSDLTNPSQDLRNFSSAFQRLAHRVTQERHSRAELASAALIQRAMLPAPIDPALLAGRCDVYADMKPARGVSGDLFDLSMLDEHRLALVVGDVCGKGVPSSLFMCASVTVLRLAAQYTSDLSAMIRQANDALCAQNAMSMFTTLFYGVLDLRTRRLDYINCGHNAPLLVSGGGCTELPGRGPPFGFFPGQRWEPHTLDLGAGDGLVMFSDGVTESMSPAGEEYGDARLAEFLAARRGLAASELVEAVIADAIAFNQGGEQSDDITCLAAFMP